MQVIVDVPDPDATDKLGERLGRFYLNSLFVSKTYQPLYLLLTGGIGAGKSCIARGFIRSLTKIKNIPSPTYLISLAYNVDSIKKITSCAAPSEKKLYHIDPYRLKKTQNLKDLHDVEKLQESVVIIENADFTDFCDSLNTKYVVRVSVRGARTISTDTDGDSRTKSSHADALLEKSDSVIDTNSLLSMGRTVTFETERDCIYSDDLQKWFGDEWRKEVSTVNDDTVIDLTEPDTEMNSESTNESTSRSDCELDNKLNETVNFYDNLMCDQSVLKDLRTRDPKDVFILGVETSCDDTCLSVIDGLGNIVVNYQLSQEQQHAQYKGVHPTVARMCHMSNLEIYMPKVFEEVYTIYKKYPDVIAFTSGPGLEVCLIEGVNKVYEFSQKYNIPIVPTHHLESHIMVCRLPNLNLHVEYPFVCCVASGGHTFICHVPRKGVYRLMSTTIDDSIGETIDKVGRELGVPSIPAGKDVEKLALTGRHDRYQMPKPYVKVSPHNMSFSGFKQMGVMLARKEDMSQTQTVSDIASSFQDGVMEYLVEHIVKVCKRLNNRGDKYTCVVLAGGVASNTVLRDKLNIVSKQISAPIKYPPPSLCTDNGVMVAWTGYEKIKDGYVLRPVTDYTSKTKVEVRTVWPLWAD